jgi:hypothetical protein
MTNAPSGTVPRSRPLLVVGLIAAGVMLLSSCGGSSSEKASGVASLGGGASTSTTVKGTPADTRQLWLDAAACLRKNGLDFPDPTFDANGRPQFNQGGQDRGPGAVFRQDDPKTQAARTACKPELDKIRAQFAPATPQEAAQRKQQILALAACMRSQGVDFPDPTFDANGRAQFGGGGGGGAGGGTGGADRRNDPAFQKAREACRAKLGDQFPSRPGGGGPGGTGGTRTPTTATSGNG